MSTQETELPDTQERGGLKRKPTGPPRLLLGKSKSKEKIERKSQRRQREAEGCDGTMDRNDDPPSNNIKNSLRKASEEKDAQQESPEETQEVLVTLEEHEGEKLECKIMSRSTSKTSIKRTISSLLICRKKKESGNSKKENPKETSDNEQNSKLSDENNKEVQNGKRKKRFFSTIWPATKRSHASNVTLGSESKDQSGCLSFHEIAKPKGATFKKIHHIFQRRKKAPSIDQFDCSAPNASPCEADDQPGSLMEMVNNKNEKNQRKKQETRAESHPETFTISAEVSYNTNTELDHADPVSTNKEETEVLQTERFMDCEVVPSCSSSHNIDLIDVPDQKLPDEPIENEIKRRPVITIEKAYSSDEENVNEAPQFEGLGINGSCHYLKINNKLYPELNVSPKHDPSQCNESLLIQTAISMVEAAISGAVEQLTTEQQNNQSLELV